ncbi:RHS repeat-associated core domain-containing protein [Aliikangiella coralliicola]|uniref:RHS repeat-associated core domain-containing protein n=1 Tax=Aliikangiella coralliicola TaxID=2592383 RepID=A0A545UEM3_9GAMM|nr:RHS repeat-associated core domain-containing protein [Aliikangiella coralliicola]TQV87929.1 RHS repeat-associated core domain-containing protein [Aliikangiella coralliicola]
MGSNPSNKSPHRDMRQRLSIPRLLLSSCLLFAGQLSYANDSFGPGGGFGGNAPPEEVKDYGYNFHEQNNITPEIPTLTTDLFGDQIDPSSGSVSFSQTDISIPGNSGLPVTITRTLSDPDSWFRETREFENWSLSIPHVRSTYITDKSGNAKNAYWAVGKACSRRLNSNPTFSKYVSYGLGDNQTQAYQGSKDSYWNGDTVSIPGQGSAKFTEKAGSYKRYNNRNWKVTCITNSDGTEGFKITLDNGVVYTMGKQRTVKSLKPFNLSPVMSLTPCNGSSRPCPMEAVGPSDPDESVQYPQYFVFMQATRVEDRFGNWVKYSYHSDGRLKQITSNDGRTITVNYSGNRVSSISANGKTWNYRYDDYRIKTLKTVVRPDNKEWSYSHDKTSNNSLWILNNVAEHAQAPHHGIQCIESGTRDFIEMTHPEGMQGKFVLEEVCQGQSEVPKIRRPNPLRRNYDTYFIPRISNLFAISTKTLTMSDGEEYIWNYDYSDNDGVYQGDSINSSHRLSLGVSGVETAHLKSTTTINPDNSKTIQYFDRRYGKTSGNLLYSEVYNEHGSLLKRSSYQYTDGEYHGKPLMYTAISLTADAFTEADITKGHAASRKQLTSKKVENFVTIGDVYTTTYSDFDVYDLPQKTYEYNDFSNKKKYTKTYYNHDKTYNLLGRHSRTEVSSSDSNYTEVSKTTYHSATGSYKSQPNYHYEFGRWYKRNQSYHTSGVQAGLPKRVQYNGASYNSASRWVEFSNYKRGKAQTIGTPQSKSTTSQYAYLEVNNDGLVTKVTDFENHCTRYSYNSIGRLTLIDPCDNRWLNTTIGYTTTSGSDGLNYVFSGMLKQTITRGNYQKITYFDNLLRPRMIKEWDKAKSSTTRYTRTSYDAFNRPTYQSNPWLSSTTNYGRETKYDALGRVVNVDDNTSSGSIGYSYLSGNRVRVNDNKGHQTTTTYLAYGSPSQSLATYIAAPENTNTTLNYNIFGNLTSITQGGITERRVYDGYQRHCKTTRPDVGNTAVSYNALNELLWSAKGSSVSSSTGSCDNSVSSSDKATYAYDNLGNVRSINYADNSPDKTFVYDKNNLLKTLTAGNVTTAYTYNSEKLLEKETLSVDSNNFVLDYFYNSNGHLSDLRYPSGTKIAFVPNALGQPTTAGAHATHATYHANGALKSHLYGNDYYYKMTQNTSGLPSTTYDKITQQGGGGGGLTPIDPIGIKPIGIDPIKNPPIATRSLESAGTATTSATISAPSRAVAARRPDGAVDVYAIKQAFTYDANSNLTFWDDQISSNKNVYDFRATYDGLDRLDRITDSYSGTGEVAYDSMGNITFYKIGNKSLNYHYNSNKQLASVTGYLSRSFQYDDKGNVTSNGVHTFNYNTAEQMYSSDAGSYVYDGNGKRVKTVDDQGTSYSMYSRDGQLVYRKINGTHVNYYHLGKKLVARKKGSTITYVHTDFLGSPAAESNSSGTVTANMHYQPFGESIETPKDEVGYTGHKFDKSLGLNYMQARYYDPVIGRFYSNDPVGYRDVYTFNRFAYANNNPYKFTDPNGEAPWVLFGALVGGGVNFVAQGLTKGFDNVDYTQVAVAAAVGATGVGLAESIGASVAGMGLTAAQSMAVNAGGNAAVGATLGALGTVTNSLVDGLQGDSDGSFPSLDALGSSATEGAIFGGLGSVVGEGLSNATVGANNVLFGKKGTPNAFGKFVTDLGADIVGAGSDVKNTVMDYFKDEKD